ncbi:MAG: SDR family oxidoreductase [Thermoanaerobaculia bacterium]
MHELEGRVAIVIGASSGIGRATAELLAKEGARVAVCSRSEDLLADLVAGHEGRMLAVAGDASDLATIERLFSACESKLGHCDLLVNCAGALEVARVVDMTVAQWETTFAVNARAIFFACRRALPSMIDRRVGTIVNVASISGVRGPQKFPGFAAYCASKAAVIAFTEALAVEIGELGVRVNAVSPGSVDTAMWAEASGGAPAAMTPDEVACAIVFLASDASRPMNGQNLTLYSS